MPVTPKFIQNLERFRLVTFDITDTLLAFKKSPAVQYSETAAKYGYSQINQQELQRTFRTEFKFLSKTYPNFGKSTPDMNWKQWWIKLVLNIFNSMKSGIPEKDALLIAEELIQLYRTDVCYKPLNGAIELVDKVKQCNKQIGVISNFDSSLPQLLKAMNLNNFDFILTSYDCGVLKPNRKIFDAALARCKVRSDQALHIGNLYELDYLGAKGAGWSSVLITQMSDEEMSSKEDLNKSHVFRSLPELLNTLNHKTIVW